MRSGIFVLIITSFLVTALCDDTSTVFDPEVRYDPQYTTACGLRVIWTPDPFASRQQVELSSDFGANFTISSPYLNASYYEYDFTDLYADTEYVARVIVTDSDGNDEEYISGIISTKTLASVVSASLSYTTCTIKADLTWPDSTLVQRISAVAATDRSFVDESTFTTAEIARGESSVTVAGLKPGVTYYVRLLSCTEAGRCSTPLYLPEVTTPRFAEPANPRTTVVDINTIQFEWEYSETEKQHAGFGLRCISNSDDTDIWETFIDDPNAREGTLAGVSAETIVSCFVTALDHCNNPTRQVPAAGMLFGATSAAEITCDQAKASISSVDLSWSSDATAATAFEIEATPSNPDALTVRTTLDCPDYSYTLEGLTPNTEYQVRVRARGACTVLSDWNLCPLITTLPLEPFTGSQTYLVTDDTLALAWMPPSDPIGVYGYQVHVATESTFSDPIDNYLVGYNNTHIEVPSLLPGMEYFARVRACAYWKRGCAAWQSFTPQSIRTPPIQLPSRLTLEESPAGSNPFTLQATFLEPSSQDDIDRIDHYVLVLHNTIDPTATDMSQTVSPGSPNTKQTVLVSNLAPAASYTASLQVNYKAAYSFLGTRDITPCYMEPFSVGEIQIPTQLKFTGVKTSSSLELSFLVPGLCDNPSHFRVMVSTSEDFSSGFSHTDVAVDESARTMTVTVSGLKAGTLYYGRVTSGWPGRYSSSVSTSSNTGTTDGVASFNKQVKNIVVTQPDGSCSANVRFDAPSDTSDVAAYRTILRPADGSADVTLDFALEVSKDVFPPSALVYSVYVVAIGTNGEVGPEAASAQTITPVSVNYVQSVTLTPSLCSMNVSFTASQVGTYLIRVYDIQDTFIGEETVTSVLSGSASIASPPNTQLYGKVHSVTTCGYASGSKRSDSTQIAGSAIAATNVRGSRHDYSCASVDWNVTSVEPTDGTKWLVTITQSSTTVHTEELDVDARHFTKCGLDYGSYTFSVVTKMDTCAVQVPGGSVTQSPLNVNNPVDMIIIGRPDALIASWSLNETVDLTEVASYEAEIIQNTASSTASIDGCRATAVYVTGLTRSIAGTLKLRFVLRDGGKSLPLAITDSLSLPRIPIPTHGRGAITSMHHDSIEVVWDHPSAPSLVEQYEIQLVPTVNDDAVLNSLCGDTVSTVHPTGDLVCLVSGLCPGTEYTVHVYPQINGRSFTTLDHDTEVVYTKSYEQARISGVAATGTTAGSALSVTIKFDSIHSDNYPPGVMVLAQTHDTFDGELDAHRYYFTRPTSSSEWTEEIAGLVGGTPYTLSVVSCKAENQCQNLAPHFASLGLLPIGIEVKETVYPKALHIPKVPDLLLDDDEAKLRVIWDYTSSSNVTEWRIRLFDSVSDNLLQSYDLLSDLFTGEYEIIEYPYQATVYARVYPCNAHGCSEALRSPKSHLLTTPSAPVVSSISVEDGYTSCLTRVMWFAPSTSDLVKFSIYQVVATPVSGQEGDRVWYQTEKGDSQGELKGLTPDIDYNIAVRCCTGNDAEEADDNQCGSFVSISNSIHIPALTQVPAVYLYEEEFCSVKVNWTALPSDTSDFDYYEVIVKAGTTTLYTAQITDINTIQKIFSKVMFNQAITATISYVTTCGSKSSGRTASGVQFSFNERPSSIDAFAGDEFLSITANWSPYTDNVNGTITSCVQIRGSTEYFDCSAPVMVTDEESYTHYNLDPDTSYRIGLLPGDSRCLAAGSYSTTPYVKTPSMTVVQPVSVNREIDTAIVYYQVLEQVFYLVFVQDFRISLLVGSDGVTLVSAHSPTIGQSLLPGLPRVDTYSIYGQARSTYGRYGNVSGVLGEVTLPALGPVRDIEYQCDITATSVTVRWRPPNDESETVQPSSYYIAFHPEQYIGLPVPRVVYYTHPEDSTQVTIHNLNPDTGYRAEVKACIGSICGESAFGSVIITGPMAVVQNVAITDIMPCKVTISWEYTTSMSSYVSGFRAQIVSDPEAALDSDDIFGTVDALTAARTAEIPLRTDADMVLPPLYVRVMHRIYDTEDYERTPATYYLDSKDQPLSISIPSLPSVLDLDFTFPDGSDSMCNFDFTWRIADYGPDCAGRAEYLSEWDCIEKFAFQIVAVSDGVRTPIFTDFVDYDKTLSSGQSLTCDDESCPRDLSFQFAGHQLELNAEFFEARITPVPYSTEFDLSRDDLQWTYSNSLLTPSLPAPTDVVVTCPSQDAGLNATTVKLTWAYSSTQLITGFRVAALDPTTLAVKSINDVTGAEATDGIVSSINPDSDYIFGVAARSPYGLVSSYVHGRGCHTLPPLGKVDQVAIHPVVIEPNQVLLHWTAVTSSAFTQGYEIKLTGGDQVFTKRVDGVATESTTVTGLVPDTRYVATISVVTYRGTAGVASSESIAFYTLPLDFAIDVKFRVVTRPDMLVVDFKNATVMKNIVGYRVVLLENDEEASSMDMEFNSVFTAIFEGLKPLTQYDAIVYVRTVEGHVVSPSRACNGPVRTAALDQPLMFSVYANTATINRVELTWTAPADDTYVYGYFIEESSNHWATIASSIYVTKTEEEEHEYRLLQADTDHRFRISSCISEGRCSGPVYPCQSPEPIVHTEAIPEMSTIYVDTIDAEFVTLNWTYTNTEDDVVGYMVEYATDRAFTTGFGEHQVSFITEQKTTVPALPHSTKFFFRVRLVDSVSGLGPASNIVYATTLPLHAAQTVVLTEVDPTTVNVTWQDPATMDYLSGFIVRVFNDDTDAEMGSSGILPLTTHEYEISCLTPGKKVYAIVYTISSRYNIEMHNSGSKSNTVTLNEYPLPSLEWTDLREPDLLQVRISFNDGDLKIVDNVDVTFNGGGASFATTLALSSLQSVASITGLVPAVSYTATVCPYKTCAARGVQCITLSDAATTSVLPVPGAPSPVLSPQHMVLSFDPAKTLAERVYGFRGQIFSLDDRSSSSPTIISSVTKPGCQRRSIVFEGLSPLTDYSGRVETLSNCDTYGSAVIEDIDPEVPYYHRTGTPEVTNVRILEDSIGWHNFNVTFTKPFSTEGLNGYKLVATDEDNEKVDMYTTDLDFDESVGIYMNSLEPSLKYSVEVYVCASETACSSRAFASSNNATTTSAPTVSGLTFKSDSATLCAVTLSWSAVADAYTEGYFIQIYDKNGKVPKKYTASFVSGRSTTSYTFPFNSALADKTLTARIGVGIEETLVMGDFSQADNTHTVGRPAGVDSATLVKAYPDMIDMQFTASNIDNLVKSFIVKVTNPDTVDATDEITKDEYTQDPTQTITIPYLKPGLTYSVYVDVVATCGLRSAENVWLSPTLPNLEHPSQICIDYASKADSLQVKWRRPENMDGVKTWKVTMIPKPGSEATSFSGYPDVREGDDWASTYVNSLKPDWYYTATVASCTERQQCTEDIDMYPSVYVKTKSINQLMSVSWDRSKTTACTLTATWTYPSSLTDIGGVAIEISDHAGFMTTTKKTYVDSFSTITSHTFDGLSANTQYYIRGYTLTSSWTSMDYVYPSCDERYLYTNAIPAPITPTVVSQGDDCSVDVTWTLPSKTSDIKNFTVELIGEGWDLSQDVSVDTSSSTQTLTMTGIPADSAFSVYVFSNGICDSSSVKVSVETVHTLPIADPTGLGFVETATTSCEANISYSFAGTFSYADYLYFMVIPISDSLRNPEILYFTKQLTTAEKALTELIGTLYVSGLDPGTQYYTAASVCAGANLCDDLIASSDTGNKLLKTLGVPTITTVPIPPAPVPTVTNSTGCSISISWEAVEDPEGLIAEYLVETSSTLWFSVDQSVVVPVSDNNVTLPVLTTRSDHSVRLTPITHCGSMGSAVGSHTPHTVPGLDAASNATVVGSTGSDVTVYWNPSNDSCVTNYVIEYTSYDDAHVGTTVANVSDVVVDENGIMSYNVSDLIPGLRYAFNLIPGAYGVDSESGIQVYSSIHTGSPDPAVGEPSLSRDGCNLVVNMPKFADSCVDGVRLVLYENDTEVFSVELSTPENNYVIEYEPFPSMIYKVGFHGGRQSIDSGMAWSDEVLSEEVEFPSFFEISTFDVTAIDSSKMTIRWSNDSCTNFNATGYIIGGMQINGSDYTLFNSITELAECCEFDIDFGHDLFKNRNSSLPSLFKYSITPIVGNSSYVYEPDTGRYYPLPSISASVGSSAAGTTGWVLFTLTLLFAIFVSILICFMVLRPSGKVSDMTFTFVPRMLDLLCCRCNRKRVYVDEQAETLLLPLSQELGDL